MLKKLSAALAAGLLASVLAACGGGGEDTASGGEAGSGKIVLGFSQVGSESGWRAANTKSVKDSAATAGIDLKFSDAQQKQENQIASIRSYIQQKVDVIAFSPVVVTGWDAVLKEAQAAKIPVILTDRAVDSDASLYATFIGSDFVKEGEEVGKWALEEFKSATGPVNIVQLEGTVGSAPAIDRKKGFEATIASNPNLKVIASQSGDFTRAKGKEVMQALLQANPKIDLLFAHNDDMGLGAIEAIKAAGLKPGTDIKIATIDAVKDGMTALAANEINFIAECSPLLGEQLMELTKKAAAGEPLEKRIVTKETTFTPQQAAEVLSTRQY
ncbi:ABC transporter substrate-binding protein [Acrocarpospora macrocephala]|uniref:LacI family transcriptional regulator n=1 Tax=Acrocarpospora macrocephala TaxID=150177 RepID=A0A5M3WVQ0_9ACTN|nr:ABC transporter substrate-binding protein [Acrocarpospora macrocephala]GES12790.1 LacI family transcriptional regulator [Acrocarpospora macrocephala]